jgi:hypothetical protein
MKRMIEPTRSNKLLRLIDYRKLIMQLEWEQGTNENNQAFLSMRLYNHNGRLWRKGGWD